MPAYDLIADLTLTIDDLAPLRIQANGTTLVVTLPDLSTALDLWERGAAEGQLKRIIKDGHRTLVNAGLTLVVVVDERPIARLGQDARPDPLAQLMGLGPLDVLVPEVLTSLTRGGGSRARRS